MKRWLIGLLLIGGLGSIAYLVLRDINPGYVLIYVGGYSFETTVVALLLAMVGLWLLLKLLWWLLRMLNPLRLVNSWLFRRLFRRVDPLLQSQQGLQDLLLGNWQQAYRALVESAERVENPAVNYLGAALAAFERGDRAAWRFCLERAEKKSHLFPQGIHSLHALLEARSGDQQEAVKVLQALQRSLPNQPLVLKQLHDNYRALNDWDGLEDILPALEKRDVLPEEILRELQIDVYGHQLSAASDDSEELLRLHWKKLPKQLRNNAKLTGLYIQQLLRHGQEVDAAGLLMSYLKKQWSDELVVLLGNLNTDKPQQQLALLENCLKQQSANPILLMTLGRLSARNQLWRKARDYFEKALPLATTLPLQAQINGELARLLEQLGERDKSLLCYQQTVQLLEKQQHHHT